MGLREWGAALLLLAGCSVKESTTEYVRLVDERPLEERIAKPKNYYERALAVKQKALAEKDTEKRNLLLAAAESDFFAAFHAQHNPYMSLLEQADCQSLEGKSMQAFKTLTKASIFLEKDKKDSPYLPDLKAIGYNAEGKISIRHDMLGHAEESFTSAIKSRDNPDSRWQRYELRMKKATTIVNKEMHIDPEITKTAFEDIDAYIKFMPDEPDGYVIKYIALGIVAMPLTDPDEKQEKINEICDTLKRLVNLLDNKKEFQRQECKKFSAQSFRDAYEKIKPFYQPKDN